MEKLLESKKIKKYQSAIIDLLEKYVAIPFANASTVEKQLIADKERNRFQAIAIGWEKDENFVYSNFLHFEIKKGKVWIQQNWTEIPVAAELMKRGVSQSDIVLGFLPEYARADTDYAVS